MKKENVGMAIAVTVVILLFGYATFQGVQQSGWSFQKKCNEIYGEGSWIRVGSQVLWANGEAKYASELSWDICIPVDYVEDKIRRWKETENE